MYHRHRSETCGIVICLGIMGGLANGAPTLQDEGQEAKWNVAIVVHEGVELLDFAGPGEVFAAASRRSTQDGRPWFNVYTVAPATGELVSQDFLTIIPEFSIENCPQPDILVIPGGATGVLTRDAAFMQWVKKVVPENDLTLTVCTGAFVLGEIGALNGREATTHWSALQGLRREVEGVTVLEDVRFVDSGDIITSAGVSAGIDGSLHVVARLIGLDTAEATAHYMEYDWRPTEEQRSSYPRFNPQLDAAGQAIQQAMAARDAGDNDRAIQLLRGVVDQNPEHAEALYELGRLLHMEGDLDAALPLHRRAAAVSEPGSLYRRNAFYNLGCALALQQEPDDALGALLASAEAGYDGARWAKDDTDLASLRSHATFKTFLAQSHINRARNLMNWDVDDVALDELEAAGVEGFKDWASIRNDPAFERVRQNPRFVALVDG